MKTLKFFLAAVLCIIIQSELHSQTSFGLYTGLSTPSDQINNVYNSDFLTASDFSGRMQRDAVALGYHVGARLRFAMGDNLVFIGGLSLSRFPESKIYVAVPSGSGGDTIRATLTTTQNIIPIAVGLNYYVVRKVLGVYATGELTYNYLMNTIDAEYNGAPIPLDQSPTYNRVGFGVGVGTDLDLKILTLNLEGKYNLVNFIGAEANEKPKSFISLSLGVYFGSLGASK